VRLIDIDEFDYENIMCSQDQLHWLNRQVEKQPVVDAVPVVRCKDCRHNIEETELYVICNVLEGFMKKDDFCSYGERKDNE
jgi:hypothetical protein